MARWRSDLLSYNRMKPSAGRIEPSAGLEPAPSSVPGTCSGHWSYEGMSWVPRARTWIIRFQGPAGCRLPHHPSGAATRGRTGSPAVRKRGRKPCAAAGELGNQGSNLDFLASEASVLPDYTIPHRYGQYGREAGTRTPSTGSQNRGANPYTTSRWRRPESNRLRRRLRSAPATSAVIPVELRGFEPRTSCMPCTCSTKLSYSPIGRRCPRRLRRAAA
jgi:hypothetical protein